MNDKSNNISYLINNIDRDVWRKFKGKSILNGYNSAADCLRQLIKRYSKGNLE
tara:strand:+ start:33 stop:191 length:159 start_codon:yes stop_codon:yes gene_type:complete